MYKVMTGENSVSQQKLSTIQLTEDSSLQPRCATVSSAPDRAAVNL